MSEELDPLHNLAHNESIDLVHLALNDGLISPATCVFACDKLDERKTSIPLEALSELLELAPLTVLALWAVLRRRVTEGTAEFTAVGRDLASNSAQVVSQTPRYMLGREIGRGGSGRVVIAQDRLVRRTVAMKMRRECTSIDDLDRFIEEAQTTGLLEHPNIIPVHDIGVLQSGELYYTMKYMGLNNLRVVVHNLRLQNGEGYSLVRLLDIFRQICSAVDYAHDMGVIHRDLKPDNVLLGDHGEVIVMDWGIAKFIGKEERSPFTPRPRRETPANAVVGTPEYMAPEQAMGKAELPAVDIYALGAILYELLCLSPPFEGDKPVQTLVKVIKSTPEKPSVRAREFGLNVPGELEQLALQCLRKVPKNRPKSAGELRRRVQEWLEGTKDEERARQLAADRVSMAQRSVADFFGAVDEVQAAQERYDQIIAGFEGWEDHESKRPLRASRQEVSSARRRAIRLFGAAEAACLQVLAYDNNNPDARRVLTQLYWQRLREAEDRSDPEAALYYKTLVERYDGGQFRQALAGEGSLSVKTTPSGASVELEAYDEQDGRWIPSGPQALGASPVELSTLNMGNYRLRIQHPDADPAQVSFKVERCVRVELDIPLYRTPQGSVDLVYVPGGPAILGGDTRASNALPRQRVHMAGFYISRYPVTLAEYLEFINHLDSFDPEAAIEHMPRTSGFGILCQKGAQGYAPVDHLIQGRARKRYPRGQGHEWFVPVFGVTMHDIGAFIQWKSRREGVAYRLPTEYEWEKAARGGDERLYPWGNHFDPTFCKMALSRPEAAMPEPVGAFPLDESPYGVRDTAGGVREWTANLYARASTQLMETQNIQRTVRGGAWSLLEHHCRLASRAPLAPDTRDQSVGFRLAVSVHPH